MLALHFNKLFVTFGLFTFLHFCQLFYITFFALTPLWVCVCLCFGVSFNLRICMLDYKSAGLFVSMYLWFFLSACISVAASWTVCIWQFVFDFYHWMATLCKKSIYYLEVTGWPQICTVILRIRIGKFAWFAVYIWGNF